MGLFGLDSEETPEKDIKIDIWARIALDSTNGRNRPYGYVELYDRLLHS